MKRRSLLFASVLLVGGCAGYGPAHPTFPAAYELLAERGQSPNPSQVTVYLYDDAFRAAAIARRDDVSVGVGGYDQITVCDAGDYCVRIEETPGPLVIFAEQRTSMIFDGWRYEMERDVLAHETCDRFTARQPTREDWFTYLNCGVLGITSITTFQGREVVKDLQLRSFLGLGSSAR